MLVTIEDVEEYFIKERSVVESSGMMISGFNNLLLLPEKKKSSAKLYPSLMDDIDSNGGYSNALRILEEGS